MMLQQREAETANLNVVPRLRVRFVRSDERETWIRFVAGVPEGHILQSWEWGEFKALHGWRPMRVVLEDTGAEGQYLA